MTLLAPLITGFLRDYMPRQRGYSPHSCEAYAYSFRLLFAFAAKRIQTKPSQLLIEQLDAALILDFLGHIERERGNGAATRNLRLASIKTFMRYVEYQPRPHNSAHYSIENCVNSQFDQHINSILDLPLGSSKSNFYAIMINLVGGLGYEGQVVYEGIKEAMLIDNVKLHIYGKHKTKPNRKMGHATVLGSNLENVLKKAKKIKELVKVKT